MASKIPKGLMITNVTVKNYHRAYTTESMSGVVRARDSGVQWFSGEIEVTSYGFNAVRNLNGFLASLRGRTEPFEIELGGAYGLTDSELPTNPKLNVNHGGGSTKISINHYGGSIPLGSVFNVPNDTKLYTLIEEVTETGTYKVTPAIKRWQAQWSEINFKTPKFTAQLTDNETTITHESNGHIARAGLSWREVLS